MTDNNSVNKAKLDNQIVNTINHFKVYPYFEMLVRSPNGIANFEILFAKKFGTHFLACLVSLLGINHFVDLSHNDFLNFYLIGFCFVIYLIGIVIHLMSQKEKIIVKKIFSQIEKIGEKGTLIYFLATLRNSSFITNKEAFTMALEARSYSTIFKELKRIFEIVEKENMVYRPTTPTRNLARL